MEYRPSSAFPADLDRASMMIAEIVATACAGLFAGAAVYISVVEYPAVIEVGSATAVRFFAAMYPRASVMQAPLALVGSIAALLCWWGGGGRLWLLGALLLAFAIPFTLVVMMPTNDRLQSAALDPASQEAADLLSRWARLHAIRSVTSSVAFLVFLGGRFRS
jgi:uncharacterized membrane protein